jgi:hypothetical protein
MPAGSTTVLAAAFVPAEAAPLGPSAAGELPPAGPADSGTMVAIAAPLGAGAAPAAPSLLSAAGWLRIVKVAWVRWLVLGSAPLLGLGLMVGLWMVVTGLGRRPPEPAPAGQGEKTASAAPSVPAPKPAPKPPPARLTRRWLPDRTALVFSVRADQLAAQPAAAKCMGVLDPDWTAPFGAALGSLKLPANSVQRLTWAASDLAVWPQRSVVIVELAPGHDTDALAHGGEAVDLGLAGLPCRRLLAAAGAAWPHPLVVVDRQTIVTGDEALLRGLARVTGAHLGSTAVDRLLAAMNPEADALLVVDLAAARTAGWKLPTAVADVWPAQKRRWHDLWETPAGLGCTLWWSEPPRSELALVCESETTAERVHADLDELLPAVKRLLGKQLEAIDAMEPDKAAAADPYKKVLEDGQEILEAVHPQVADGIVLLRWSWKRAPWELAAAAVDGFPFLRDGWLAAGLAADEKNHQGIQTGLLGFQKAEGHFPAGAGGGTLLPPETRLSWIASLLPYFGHADWHRQLEFGYSWNSPPNRQVSQRPLAEVINPVLGPAATPAGFPVTHYVGVAGVGPDAGRLAVDDPHAGVFGYARVTRPADITRGTANCIAVLGVSGRCGAWASGGEASVRPLCQRPYVNGPDGFGSGQPGGMVAGMADGSVRFISKDVDPRVLEQLATIHGNDGASVAALEPKPAGPAAEVQGPVVGPGEAKAAPDEEAKDEPAFEPADAESDAKPRLAAKLPDIKLDTPLGDALDTLSALSAVPITIDPDALVAAGASLSDPVSVHLADATIGEILEKILAARKLAAVAEGGRLVVTTPAAYRETLRPAHYAVADLTGDDAKATAELAALVQKLVAPESWQLNGGRGSIRPEPGALAVVQTGAVYDQVVAFCEKLRAARGKPTLSRSQPDRFALSTRRDRAKAILGQPVSVNFIAPAPLAEVLRELKKQTGAEVFLDRAALPAADEAKAALSVQKQPLSAALTKLFEPLGLAYRVVDARTIQATSRKVLAARLELEFYRLPGGPAGQGAASAVIERIKDRVAGPTWSDAGGAGVIHFDPASHCLIVLQSQPVQIAVEALLAQTAR